MFPSRAPMSMYGDEYRRGRHPGAERGYRKRSGGGDWREEGGRAYSKQSKYHEGAVDWAEQGGGGERERAARGGGRWREEEGKECSLPPEHLAEWWTCPACSFTNKPHRLICCLSCRTPRPGNWVCPSCGNVNTREKLSCHRRSCQTVRRGNWVCPRCETLNWVRSLQCCSRGCRQFQPGCWVCSSCSANNFGDRQVCYRCLAPCQEDHGLNTGHYEDNNINNRAREFGDDNVLCQEREVEDSQDHRVEERKAEGQKGESGRRDSNENEVETKEQNVQLPLDQFSSSVDHKTIMEELDDREEGEIVEETKDSDSNKVKEADENEKASADAQAVIQSSEKERENQVEIRSEEQKQENKKIKGILVLPDNIYYNLESPDDELGLYYTDSEMEDEPEGAPATSSGSVEQQSYAVSEEALHVGQGEKSLEKKK